MSWALLIGLTDMHMHVHCHTAWQVMRPAVYQLAIFIKEITAFILSFQEQPERGTSTRLIHNSFSQNRPAPPQPPLELTVPKDMSQHTLLNNNNLTPFQLLASQFLYCPPLLLSGRDRSSYNVDLHRLGPIQGSLECQDEVSKQTSFVVE